MITPPRGSILVYSLIMSGLIMLLVTSFFGYFGSSVGAERSALAGAQAQALAEAGMDEAVYQLNQNSNYSGETGTPLGNGVFTVSVSSIDSDTKSVIVSASVPSAAHPAATKVIKATVAINASVVSFRYGVETGQGGVLMNNGSAIHGNLFADGSVSGSGTITGDVTVAMGTSDTPDQSWSVQNSGFNIGDTAAHADVAESFKPSTTGTLTRLTLNLKKTGAPGDLAIKIVTDNSGKPSKTVLASGTLSASLVTSAYGFADVTLGSTPVVTAGQTYWIIAAASVSAVNYFTWGLDSSSGYSGGASKYSSNWNASSPAWTAITGDLDFAMYESATTTLSGVTVGGNAWASGLSSCSVGGNASYLTLSSCSVAGTKYPNTQPAAPIPFPISDAQIADWETTAASGGTIAGPYTPSGNVTMGPKKINGDLTLANGAALTLTGPVWVNGNITLANNATLTVSPATGNSGAILIADATGNTAAKGQVDIANNTIISGNGSANSFPMIISTNTGSEAINVSNNAAGVILYAPYGTIEISNNASVNQVTAKLLQLNNNASIDYVSGLQNASFSNGPGGSWAVVPGTYAILQ